MFGLSNEKLGVEKIHHVAFAAEDLEGTLELFRDKLGFDPAVLDFKDQTEVAFYVGEVQVQFYIPKKVIDENNHAVENQGNKYVNWLKMTNGNIATHHICYLVRDLNKTIAAIREAGMDIVETVPGKGSQGFHVQIKPEYTMGCEVEFLELADYLKGKSVAEQDKIVRENFKEIMAGTYKG